MSWYAQKAGGGSRWLLTAFVAVQLAISAYLWQFPRAFWNDGDGVSAFQWTAWLPSWTDAGSAPVFAAWLLAAVMIVLALAALARSGHRLATPQAP